MTTRERIDTAAADGVSVRSSAPVRVPGFAAAAAVRCWASRCARLFVVERRFQDTSRKYHKL